MEAFIFIILGLVAFGFLLWLSQEPCPHCETRGSVRWKHRNKNGGPDLRYKENYRYCTNCHKKL